MTSKAISGAVSAVLPYVALAGGALLLVKSGILGKLWSDLTGTIDKKVDEIYSSVYNNRTVENIRNITNVQNVVETVLGPKTYVDAVIEDPDGNVIDFTQPVNVVTTEGRTLIPVQIPGASSDYMMTILGPAKSGTDKYTVLEPGHFERKSEDKAWWQKNAFDLGRDVWDFLMPKKETYVTPQALGSSAYHSGIITPKEPTAMEPIQKYEPMTKDEQRNHDAKYRNEYRLRTEPAKHSSDNPMDYLAKEYNKDSVADRWPTPWESTQPFYGSKDVERALTGGVVEKKDDGISDAARERGYVGH